MAASFGIEEGNVDIKARGSNWKYVAIFFILISVTLGAYTVYDHAQHAVSQPEVKCTTPVTKTTATPTTTKSSTTTLVTRSTEAVCLTSTCIIAASQITQSMNTTVDPCENFYDYACGNWGEHHPVPKGRKSYGVISAIEEDVHRKLQKLLISPVEDGEPKSVTNTKNTYQSCLDIETIDKLGSGPLEISLHKYGGWPIAIDNLWKEEEFDVYKVLSMQMMNGVHSLINTGVIVNRDNWDEYVFAMDVMRTCLPAFMYGDEENMFFYKNFIVDVSVILGAKLDRAQKEAQEIVDFEKLLINELITDSDYLIHYRRTLTYGQLSELSDKFDFKTFIVGTFDKLGLEMKEDQNITTYVGEEYFTNLTRIIDQTDKRVVANYMLWHTVYKSVTHLSPALFRKAISTFITGLYGDFHARDRNFICSRGTSRVFTWPIGRMFVEKYFDESAKDTASEMVVELKSAFKEMLDKVDWMDQAAIDVAKEKADAIQKRIGYPEYIMDNEKLDAMFEGITTSEYTFFENWESIQRFSLKKSLASIGIQKESDAWLMPPSTVNAFYNPLHNRITFPAGILQIPFYHKSYPKYLNFAGIGFVIGHEITHGFDNEGRKYDKDGNNHTWWSKEVTKKYEQRIKCYVSQYNNFTVGYQHVNGIKTLNENLADNGAVKESFLAYRNYVKDELKGIEEPMLPGFEDKTQNQLFFLNVAQAWCNKVVDKTYWDRALKGVHSPGRFRILGSMANSDDFSKAYNCKVGSKMNPVHKCKLW